MTDIQIPSFNWAAFYYPQILEALIQHKRINVPELTNESPEEPLVQMTRGFALVGHLNSVLADIVANESTLVTAKLVETVRNMLRLIAYEMSPNSPAQADVVFLLSQVLAATTEIIPAYSQVATRRQGTVAGAPYEILEAVSTTRTDRVSSVLAWDESVGAYTDYTAEAIDATPGQEFTPWGSPVQAKDALYIGHTDIEWNKVAALLDTVGAGLTGVWEYHDGDTLDAKPDAVTKPGAYLKFELNDLLGTADRTGATVRVQFDQTGAYLDLESQFSGGVNFVDTNGSGSPYLGQSDPPSEDASDYTVGTLWKEVPDLSDGTVTGGSDWAQTGDVDFTLPESLTDEWEQETIQGVTAYWLRYRVISVSTPTAPIVDSLRIDTGGQYLKALAVQGHRQIDSPLGTSDGSETQEFPMSKENFIWDSETVTVDTVAWVRVTNFLQSRPTDRHYMVVLGENDRATVRFGDGTRGAVPDNGAIIASDYRYGAQLSGNVGASTIVVDNSGIPYVSRLWNPRAAVGWQKSQGADEESLELTKIQGPASFRVIETALGPDDVVLLATDRYVDANGVKPFSRGKVIEGSFGPKTMELVVVAAGAGVADAEMLDGVELYLNGDQYAHPPVRKRVVGNQQVTATNYIPKTINVSADVYGDTTAAIVISRLTALLQPEAKQDDGVTWEWEYGEAVNLSRMTHEIFNADTDIYKVANILINGSASDEGLAARELPVAGTLAITVHP